ncbi:transmembrane protein 130 isoform X1 [Megalobrama amblycephala]|uniref:transmembrane protein 130 isoform X1 n=1 Tax=Megalobrama amblycephala TaxID=75352 RepID=UPI0020143402|nr:transmembrane protein 130 isoform X1 [Megalobrama amblycephala]
MNWIQSVVVHSLISSLAFGIPNELSHQLSGNVKGKIIFHQMEGNSTYLRDSGKLASYIPTVVSFELSDPRHNLHSVTFIYTWDLGNGEVRKGSEPFVKCYYTLPGNYTFKLSITTNAPHHSRMTGLYSADLTVLDAIRSIELRGPLIYNVDESSNLSFQVGGSPPVWLCWRVLSDCQTPSPDSCNLVRLYGNIFNLSYTFTSVGTYCLDLSVRNNISNLQTSYNIYVQSSHVSLIFILPCAAVIIATLIFISVTVCRPRQQSLTSKALVADMKYLSFTDIELRVKDATIPLQGNSPASKTNEALPLLHQPEASYNTQPFHT